MDRQEAQTDRDTLTDHTRGHAAAGFLAHNDGPRSAMIEASGTLSGVISQAVVLLAIRFAISDKGPTYRTTASFRVMADRIQIIETQATVVPDTITGTAMEEVCARNSPASLRAAFL